MRETACLVSTARCEEWPFWDSITLSPSVTVATKGDFPLPPHLASGFLKFRGGFTAPLVAQKVPVSLLELLDSEEQFFTALSQRGSDGNPSGNFHWSWILTNLGSNSDVGSSYMCNSNLSSLREKLKRKILKRSIFTCSAL